MQRRGEPWRWGAQWPAIGSWQEPTERIIKAGPLKTAREVAEEFSIDHSVVIWHLNQIGKVKKLDKRVPHELTLNQKMTLSFWSVIISYSTQYQQTSSQLYCDILQKVDFIWQPATTSSVVGIRSSRGLPRAKLAPHKGHGHCWVVSCQANAAFWIPVNIWEVCPANPWDSP